MAIKTLGTGGDYATFTAAVAGIATWDILNVLTAGTYTEAAALAISKTVEIVNLSGGQVVVRTPLGSPVGQISGGVTVTWTGDFVHEIRKPGSFVTEYHWLISGSGSKILTDGVRFRSDYTTGNTQCIYQANNNSHELRNVTVEGVYDAVVTIASSGICASSVIDGMAITGTTKCIVHGITSTPLFGSFDHRNIAGVVSTGPYLNGTASNLTSVSTSGLLTTSRMRGMNGAGYTTFGTGTIKIEKSVFAGSRAFAFECVSGSTTGTTFRDCEFCGFSAQAISVANAPIPDLIDYCGASQGCPTLSTNAGSLGTHNQTSDPLFVDYANHDYHLLSTSPRRDAGVACIATVDPDGNAIPQGFATDIGAYEYFLPDPVYPVIGAVDNSIRHATDLTGSPLPKPTWEIVPTNDDGPVTDVKAMLMLWAMIDRRIPPSELPPDMRDQEWPDCRGWMAEPGAGNRLWYFDRRPLSNDVDEQCRLYLMDDLKWLTADGVAASYTVAVTHTGRRRNVEIAVKRLDGTIESYGTADLWQNRMV